MNIRALMLASCVALVSLSGCAFTTERVDIQYNQQPGVAKVPGADSVSVKVQVTDLRQDKSRVSVKKNGYGMEMAPIVTVEDIAITIRKAIEQELRERGFQLDSDTALVQINAGLTRFYNDHKTGFFSGEAVADLNMSITIKSKSGDLLYARQVVAQGIEQNTQLMTGNNARLALNKALETGMRSLFEDKTFLAVLIQQPKQSQQPQPQPQKISVPNNGSMSIEAAMGKCAALGFKPNTEKFGDCALELSR
jgi:uncharacterized lipoprotein